MSEKQPPSPMNNFWKVDQETIHPQSVLYLMRWRKDENLTRQAKPWRLGATLKPRGSFAELEFYFEAGSCSPGYPQTCDVAEDDLEILDSSASISQVLGFPSGSTIPITWCWGENPGRVLYLGGEHANQLSPSPSSWAGILSCLKSLLYLSAKLAMLNLWGTESLIGCLFQLHIWKSEVCTRVPF